LFDFVLPAIPPVPPLPELPSLPSLPPLPSIEAFHLEFGGQGSFATANPEVRLQQEVFRALLRNNPERALDLATERLKADPGDSVVLGNLSGIANSGSTKAIPLLISIAKTSPNTAARREAVLAISRGPNEKEVLATLEDLYASNSDNVEIRRTVVTAIGRSSDPRAVSLLARIIKNDADETIRRTAIQQLGLRKETEAMKALEDLLRETPKSRG
jgi:HEAT repeat protein